MWHDVGMMALGAVALVSLIVLVLFGLAWWAHAAEQRDNLARAEALKAEREQEMWTDAITRVAAAIEAAAKEEIQLG